MNDLTPSIERETGQVILDGLSAGVAGEAPLMIPVDAATNFSKSNAISSLRREPFGVVTACSMCFLRGDATRSGRGGASGVSPYMSFWEVPESARRVPDSAKLSEKECTL